MKKTYSNANFNLAINGASISACPWMTWVDCLKQDTGINCTHNYACKGAGNEFLTRGTVDLLSNTEANLVATMYTNFDKFDQWVQEDKLNNLKKEKHPPRWINGEPAVEYGYWSTGSFYPLQKKIFKDNFYSPINMAAQQLTQILGSVQIAAQKNKKYLILFDSPILDYIEEQFVDYANNGTELQPMNFSTNTIVATLVKELEQHVVDFRGLIGHCLDNNLPWKNKKYGLHPPSISHYDYYVNVIRPWIQKNCTEIHLQGLDKSFIKLVEKMTLAWQKEKF